MRRVRGDEGTSTLELVGFLPVVAVVLVALIQGGVAVHAVSATQNAARNAARELARTADADGARASADRSLPAWLTSSVQPQRSGGSASVDVEVDIPDLVPGVDLRVRRSAVFPAAVLP